MRYGLHKKLKLPERQASSLRDSKSAQGKATIYALASAFLTGNATRSDRLQGSNVLSLTRHPLISMARHMWAACTGTRISRSLQSGLEVSCGPKWKLRTRPCARNISCHPPTSPPSRLPVCPQLIILRPLRPPHRKVQNLIRRAILRRIPATLPDTCHRQRLMGPSRGHVGRAARMIDLVPTASISLAASAGDDGPIRKKATPRSQVSRSAFDSPSGQC